MPWWVCVCVCMWCLCVCGYIPNHACICIYHVLSLLNVLCLLVLIFIHFGLLLAISSNIFGHYFFQIIFCLYPLWVCTYTYIKHANIISQVIEAQFIIFFPFFFSLCFLFPSVYVFVFIFTSMSNLLLALLSEVLILGITFFVSVSLVFLKCLHLTTTLYSCFLLMFYIVIVTFK